MLNGDPSRLTPEQRETIVRLMAAKFKVPEADVRAEIEKGNLPIKAEGCGIAICRFHSGDF